MDAREEIVALCRRLGAALEAGDAEAMAACYAPDAVICDMAPPLMKRGADPAATAAWLAGWEAPPTIEGEGGQIAVADGVAWSTALTRMQGSLKEGTAVDLWFRTTLCFRKVEGAWLIAHDHSSVPFYMDGSLRAAVDLTPQSEVAWDSPAP